MVASSTNRQAFIASLTQLLNTYGFDGVDLDWEYPAAGEYNFQMLFPVVYKLIINCR